MFGLNSARCSGFVLCAGGLHSKAGSLAAGWAQIPWSLIRASIKTFPRALFVPLKRGPRGVPTGTVTRSSRMCCFPGCVQFGNKLGRAGFYTQRMHRARPAPFTSALFCLRGPTVRCLRQSGGDSCCSSEVFLKLLSPKCLWRGGCSGKTHVRGSFSNPLSLSKTSLSWRRQKHRQSPEL